MKEKSTSFWGYFVGIIYLLILLLAGTEVEFFKLIPAGIVGIASFSIVNQIKIKVKKDGQNWIYNPAEYLYYLALLISEFSGYALYRNLDHNELGFSNQKFTLVFIIIYFVIPAIIFFYFLIVNRNDQIILDDQSLKWVDNKQEFSVSLSSIQSVEILKESTLFFYPTSQIKLAMSNGESKLIPAHKMNFSAKGVQQVFQELTLRINQ